MKYRHSEAVSKLVRNGLDAIIKLEFFQIINNVRYEAIKKKSIKSAFKKTGISPFNPQVIINQIRKLHPEQFEEEEATLTPPSTPTNNLFSSPFQTPHNCRSVEVAFRYLNVSIKKLSKGEASSEAIEEIQDQVIRVQWGVTTITSHNNQIDQRLTTIENTQKRAREMRSRKNYRLQNGGVLIAEGARRMVVDKKEKEAEKKRKAEQRKEDQRRKKEEDARKKAEREEKAKLRQLQAKKSK